MVRALIGVANTIRVSALFRMLKKSSSGVLASLRGSTYRSVRLTSSLTAALLDGLFEHPEAIVTSVPFCEIPTAFYVSTKFFRSLSWSSYSLALDHRLANSMGFLPLPLLPGPTHEHATIVRKLAGLHSLNLLACIL